MGVEPSDKLQVKCILFTCNICGRKFEKIQALNTHLKLGHKNKNKPAPVKTLIKKRPKFDVKAVKLVRKKVIHSKRPGLNMSPPKSRTNIAPKVNEVTLENRMIAARRKTVFKCPKCVKIFGVYFSAYKHIQKYHCVDANDQPVEQNSSLLIKPIRIEPCNICSKPQMEMHVCTKSPEVNMKPMIQDNSLSMCLGCQNTFENLEEFDEHVKNLHANNIDSLFFPSYIEYVAWKTALETSTKTKFTMRTVEKKPIQNTIYHCSHLPSIEMDKTLICPSFLRVTEFKNGYQVFYYKDHYGHTCSHTQLVKYKKYSISSYLNEFDIKNLDSDKNVYQQFKSIMDSIINNTTKLDNSVLNTLLGKALDMTVVLNNIIHNEDDEQYLKKNMTDSEISQALAEVKTYPGKKRMDSVNKEVKKNNSESENNEESKGNSSSETELSPRSTNPRTFIQSPQSFNDTYKDFVDQTIIKQQNHIIKKTAFKKKIVMKTKMGQFKPNISPKGSSTMASSPRSSPKKELSLSPKPTANTKGPRPAMLSKSSGKSRLSPHTLKRSPTPNPPKESPLPAKKSKQNEIAKFKIKPDIKYEVKEQENDCNILILKI